MMASISMVDVNDDHKVDEDDKRSQASFSSLLLSAFDVFVIDDGGRCCCWHRIDKRM